MGAVQYGLIRVEVANRLVGVAMDFRRVLRGYNHKPIDPRRAQNEVQMNMIEKCVLGLPD